MTHLARRFNVLVALALVACNRHAEEGDVCASRVIMELVEAPSGYNGTGTSIEATDLTADDRPLLQTWDAGADDRIDWTDTYTYDADSNLAVRERLFGWGAVERDVYTYDAEDNPLTWEEDSGPETPVTKRTTYAYDALGQLEQEVEVDRAGEVWRTTTYTYDDAGNRILVEHEYGTEFDDATTETYTYDADGNVLIATWDDHRSNGGRAERRWTYTYEDGDLVLAAIDDASNGSSAEGVDGADDWFQVYTHEAHRVVQIATHVGSLETQPTGVETFSYDAEGRALTAASESEGEVLRSQTWAYGACDL